MNNPTASIDDVSRGRFQKKFKPYGVRVSEETLDEIEGYDDCEVVTDQEAEEVRVEIENEHGTLTALWGQWIMTDSEGTHYPITHEELQATYELDAEIKARIQVPRP